MLPGIRFDTNARIVGEVLPRMDVAAFVGFAARGPLHLPVMVEDAAAFARTFGESPELAIDRSNGQSVRALLGPAVRAFFDNGGRRCWVVRVARSNARANRFALCGWWRGNARAGGLLVDNVQAVARCEGRWSDTLRVSARPRWRTLRRDAIFETFAGVSLTLSAGLPPVPHDLLCLDTGDGSLGHWLPLTQARALEDGRWDVLCPRAWAWVADCIAGGVLVPAGIALLQQQTRARIVNMDIEALDTRDGKVRRLTDLGVVRGHPRDWRQLAGDATLHDPTAKPSALDWLRFPLAGLGPVSDHGDSFELPLGPGLGSAAGPERDGLTPLQRDGLDAFDASLFLDSDLAGLSRARLLERADELRFTGPAPRQLIGVHALLGDTVSTLQDEISLLAVPDAVHAGWSDGLGGSGSEGSDEDPIQVLEPDVAAPAPTVTPPTFVECSPRMLPPTAWRMDGCHLRPDGLELQWQGVPEQPGLRYRLEAASAPDFALPDTVQQLELASASFRGALGGERYLRVRAERPGYEGSWSKTLRVRPPALPQVELKQDHPALWPVHAALLRLAAARGDWFAVLALPAAWREEQALAHARRLSTVEAGAYTPSTGSFGALFHPWALVADAAQGLSAVPPDGLAAALAARRSLQRGAWVAPANEPLQGVVALTPPLLSARQEELDAGRVNVLRREPAAFVTMSESTLAEEPELVSWHVRRLLSLLRRLALRLGAEFVFEPNNLALRVAVQTRFDHVLQRLYQRGAFDGARVEDAFQVMVSPGSDEASLVVELRVRPAGAIRFITVRLVLAGAGVATAEVL